MHALPLDMMRVLAGGVLFFYFLNALRQAGDFSDPDGLIDHRLSARLFPPTRISLFQPGMPGWVFRAVYLGACAAAILVVIGYHPRLAAAYLFAAAVSTYRWNALVAYLDDSIVHLFCLWLLLLPVGSTLNLPDLLDAGAATTAAAWTAAIADWSTTTITGTAPRAFMANMALIYLVAGLYKFSSPMWRNGSAMHAALKMPIARAPDFWTIRHRTFLRLVTHAALILEPLFVLIFVLPANSAAKWGLLAAAIVFHAGIIASSEDPILQRAHAGRVRDPVRTGNHAGRAATRRASFHRHGRARQRVGGSRRARSRCPPGDHERLAGGKGLAPAPQTGSAILLQWLGEPGARAPLARGDLPELPPLRLGGCAQLSCPLRGVEALVAAYRTRRAAAHSSRTACGTSSSSPISSTTSGCRWKPRSAKPSAGRCWRGTPAGSRAHTPTRAKSKRVAVVQRITPDNLELTRGEELPLMRFTCAGGRAVVRFPDDPDLPA